MQIKLRNDCVEKYRQEDGFSRVISNKNYTVYGIIISATTECIIIDEVGSPYPIAVDLQNFELVDNYLSAEWVIERFVENNKVILSIGYKKIASERYFIDDITNQLPEAVKLWNDVLNNKS